MIQYLKPLGQNFQVHSSEIFRFRNGIEIFHYWKILELKGKQNLKVFSWYY